jgi:hypothetical protein
MRALNLVEVYFQLAHVRHFHTNLHSVVYFMTDLLNGENSHLLHSLSSVLFIPFNMMIYTEKL